MDREHDADKSVELAMKPNILRLLFVIVLTVIINLVAASAGKADLDETQAAKKTSVFGSTNSEPQSVEMILAARCDKCELAKPILVDLTFSNKTTEVCLLNSYDHLIEYAYNLQLTDEQGRPVPMTPYMETAGRGRPRPHSDFLLPDRDIRPKESKQWPQPIDLLNLFEIKNAGVYMLTASGNFRFLPSRRLCHSVSAPLRITVVNPSSEPKSSTDRIR